MSSNSQCLSTTQSIGLLGFVAKRLPFENGIVKTPGEGMR